MRISRPLLFALALCGACSGPTSGTTAITNVTLIDAVSIVRKRQTVVLEGDEIVAILPAGEAVDAVTTIDGTGKFLIPGLWDFHVHLTYDDRFTPSMPEMFLSYGITSVRDTGGLMHNMLPVVESMRAPDTVAPRVFFAGPLLDGNFVVYDGDSRPEIGVRNATPADAKATVADLKEQGVDFIKIYELVAPEVFAAMVEAAQELGLPIDSHVPLSMRASTAGPQVDAMEHLRNIEMDCASNSAELHETRLQLLKNPDQLSGFELRSSLHDLQRLPAIVGYDEGRCDQTLAALQSTTQVPTLRLIGLSLVPPYSRSDWDDALARTPALAREEWRAVGEARQFDRNEGNAPFIQYAEWAMFLVERMHAKGIPLGAGTDTPIGVAIPGFSLHSELDMLVRAGLSPLQAIEAATLRPARWFSIEDELGTIDVGKKADLVLLNDDPLADINNTRSIHTVISKGRAFTADELLMLVSQSQSASKK
jgi:cytosine/adenosine deaminase-related metal-dependent hydrolase